MEQLFFLSTTFYIKLVQQFRLMYRRKQFHRGETECSASAALKWCGERDIAQGRTGWWLLLSSWSAQTPALRWVVWVGAIWPLQHHNGWSWQCRQCCILPSTVWTTNSVSLLHSKMHWSIYTVCLYCYECRRTQVLSTDGSICVLSVVLLRRVRDDRLRHSLRGSPDHRSAVRCSGETSAWR